MRSASGLLSRKTATATTQLSSIWGVGVSISFLWDFFISFFLKLFFFPYAGLLPCIYLPPRSLKTSSKYYWIFLSVFSDFSGARACGQDLGVHVLVRMEGCVPKRWCPERPREVSAELSKRALTNELPVIFIALQALLDEFNARSRYGTVFIIWIREWQSTRCYLSNFYSTCHSWCFM